MSALIFTILIGSALTVQDELLANPNIGGETLVARSVRPSIVTVDSPVGLTPNATSLRGRTRHPDRLPGLPFQRLAITQHEPGRRRRKCSTRSRNFPSKIQ
jgi:hypothetical protein